MAFTKRDIFKEPLSVEELKQLREKSGQALEQFMNSKGKRFKELGLKEKLAEMSDEQKYTLMAEDPMLIKRPIIETEQGFIFGFDKAKIDALL